MEKAGIPIIILIVLWVVYSLTQPSLPIQSQSHSPTSTLTGVGQQLVYKTISVSDARAMIQSSSNLLVVDVRTPEEYTQGHLKGAINIPLSDLQLRIGGLEQNRPMLVYCQTGSRSAQASSILVKAGFTQVYNLDGGMTAWINSGYPTVNAVNLEGVHELVWNALVMT